MARHHDRFAPGDEAHGIGDIARGNAKADVSEQFGTGVGGRTQALPPDYGTGGYPEPFDRGFRGRGPKGYLRPDERILEDVCERLWDADDVDASEITVAVHGGEVTLSGEVAQRAMRHRAEDIVDACVGVKDIHNDIRVRRT